MSHVLEQKVVLACKHCSGCWELSSRWGSSRICAHMQVSALRYSHGHRMHRGRNTSEVKCSQCSRSSSGWRWAQQADSRQKFFYHTKQEPAAGRGTHMNHLTQMGV